MDNRGMALNGLVNESLKVLAAKQAAFLAEAGSLTTLVIGSSHGDYAFDPGRFPGAFNFCCGSQDLKHDAVLYDYCANRAPNLRDVIVFYSVFSTGFLLEKSSEAARCAVYKALFAPGFPYASEDINTTFAEVQEALPGYALDMAAAGDAGFIRSDDRFFFPEGYGAARRAADHMKHNARGGADIYLVKILDMAEQLGHRVTVILPPVRDDYRRELNATTEQLFWSIVELKTHFRYEFGVVNLFDDPEFDWHHFGDFDHLRAGGPGPEILTDRLSHALRAADASA
jgi:hypothetical protein